MCTAIICLVGVFWLLHIEEGRARKRFKKELAEHERHERKHVTKR